MHTGVVQHDQEILHCNQSCIRAINDPSRESIVSLFAESRVYQLIPTAVTRNPGRAARSGHESMSYSSKI